MKVLVKVIRESDQMIKLGIYVRSEAAKKKKKKGRGKERMNAEVSTINSTLGMGNGIK